MSKMGEELEKRLDENKYQLYEACKAGLEEILYFREDAYDYYAETTVKILRDVIAKIEGVK